MPTIYVPVENPKPRGLKASAPRWMRERDDILIKYHHRKLSFSRIAENMGLTRNQVAGRCWRLGLTRPRACA